MGGKARGEFAGGVAHPAEADVQGFKAAVQKPRLERAGDGAGQTAVFADAGDEGDVAAGDVAEQHIGMAGGGLGVGGDHDIGAEVERALQIGGHGGVVGDDEGPGGVGAGTKRRDIKDIKAGVGGGFDQDGIDAGEIGLASSQGSGPR